MLSWRRYIGLFMIATSVTVQAANGTMTVTTTVFTVQCTTEQRMRFRACARTEQQSSIGSYMTMMKNESRPGQRDVVAPRQEILVDPSRQVMIKSLLY
jgi:hypothetical protein